MAEENSNVEVSDRGLFGFGKKDEVKNEEEGLVTGVENLKVEEAPVEKKEEEKKGSLAAKLHRSDSSSSSSSSDEEEVGPDGEIKKKKKLKEKIKEKFGGDKKDETAPTPTPVAAAPVAPASLVEPDNTNVVIEKMEEDVKAEPVKEEEKKGFLDKIKDKLPGHGPKKEAAPAPTPVPVSTSTEEVEGGEKKGLLGKIMDKIPGYHKEDKVADKTDH